jgi:hypothetical protein
VSFRRLTAGHLIAFLAALLLLLSLAPDWYTDKVGEQRRHDQGEVIPHLNGDSTPSDSQLLGDAADQREKNAWQAPGLIDKLILLVLLAAAGLAIAGAFLRAAGRDVGPPSPSALATLAGLAGCVLIVYRILQPPGFNDVEVVKWGAPAALLCAGLVAIGSRMATRAEREPRPAETQATGSLRGEATEPPPPPPPPPAPAGAA